jgi:mitochondrial import receptor subunit TOM70
LMQAAQCFTEALDLIRQQQNTSETSTTSASSSSSLNRQVITLLNNRSAMYEKANMPELSLGDVTTILETYGDVHHEKARTRALRLLEQLNRWYDALVQVCALQLLFMQTHRATLSMGLPLPSHVKPPVPANKMEELVAHIVPTEMAKYLEDNDDNDISNDDTKTKKKKRRSLPAAHTIQQLLKSYTDYNGWMALAARDGPPVPDGDIPSINDNGDGSSDTPEQRRAQRAVALLKRGRRLVYEKQYEAATVDFEAAYAAVENNTTAQACMSSADATTKYTDSYARLLEWLGMVRHWHRELEQAADAYAKCSAMEPQNALILVKQAGVQTDHHEQEKALEFFAAALALDPTSTDALFHRANLYMLQGKSDEAKSDLEACLKSRPNHVMARLRLASILSAMQDAVRAREQLDLAEQSLGSSGDANTSMTAAEILSYRGELFFTQGEMQEARHHFEKAIAMDPSNPTPYMNAALTILNTPPEPGQMPDAKAVMEFLEKAIAVDQQFTAAYIHLGQLKLGTARDLESARRVITLYDQALEHCRQPEEVKELCSMRVLAVAQVDAATMLHMETFSMQ